MVPILMSAAAATTEVLLDMGDAVIWRLTMRKTTKLHRAAMAKALRRMVNNLRFMALSRGAGRGRPVPWVYVVVLPKNYRLSWVRMERNKYAKSKINVNMSIPTVIQQVSRESL